MRSPAYLVFLTVIGGLYIGAAKLGIHLPVAHGVITPVWAPTGIALASLVLFGRRLWPAVALGALVANATSGASFDQAAAISVGNTLEAALGATLLLRVGFRPTLDRVRDVLALILLAAVASTMVSATNGVTTLWLTGTIPGSNYGSEWLLWWLGDAMGDLIVAPLLLVWLATPLRRLRRGQAVEALSLLALLVGLSSLVFLNGSWQYPHLLFPLLIWAPLRFRQLGAVTGSFLVSAIAIAGAVNGTIPLGPDSGTETVQLLEGLLAAIIGSTLVLGAVLAEREQAERELGRAHTRLAEAQEVAHVGSWEWSIPEDRVSWSDELYSLYGLEPQSVEVSYESFLELVHASDRELVRRTVEQALLDRQPFVVDHRVALTNDRVRWLQERGRTVVDKSGSPARMVGTAQDITDRKHLDTLRDNILSAVSHELRTPLTSILGFSLTLKEKGAQLADDVRAQIVEHLAEQAHKLDQLLVDLLDLDRLRRGFVYPAFHRTDVDQLVARVTADYRNSGHPIELRTEPVVAEVDGSKLERIVDNLIANAVKHTAPGTEIRVSVEPCDEGTLITVADRGSGVPIDQREAIFEIFNRGALAVSPVPGAGIGLSLVAQLAALHGGQVWVEENPGGGARFRVLLRRQLASPEG